MLTRSDGVVVLGMASLMALLLGTNLLLSHALPQSTLLTGYGLTFKDQSFSLDINRASVAELMELPGIGPALAERIVRYRFLHGPFRSVEELLEIPGIGPQILEGLRQRVRVCPPTAC